MHLVLRGALIAALLRAATAQTPQLTLDECFDRYERGIYPHPEDCNKFLSCATTEPLDCPAGLHFNPVEFVCDWPASAGCMKVTTPAPDQVSEPAATSEAPVSDPRDGTASSTPSGSTAGEPEKTVEPQKPSETATATPSKETTSSDSEGRSETTPRASSADPVQSTTALGTSREPQKSAEPSTVTPSSRTTPSAQTAPTRATMEAEEGTSKLTTSSDAQKPTGSDNPSQSSTTTPSSQTAASESEKPSETTSQQTPTESERSTVKSTAPDDGQKSEKPSESVTTPLPQTAPGSSEKPSEVTLKPTATEPEEGMSKLTTPGDTQKPTGSDQPPQPTTTTPSSQTPVNESEKPLESTPKQTPTESDQSTAKPTSPGDAQKPTESEQPPQSASTIPPTEPTQTTPGGSESPTPKPLSTESKESTVKPTTLGDGQKPTGSEKPSELVTTTPSGQPQGSTPSDSEAASDTTPKPKPSSASGSPAPSASDKPPTPQATSGVSEKPKEPLETTPKGSSAAPEETTSKPSTPSGAHDSSEFDRSPTTPSTNESPGTTLRDSAKPEQSSETASPSDSDDKPSSPGKRLPDKAETTLMASTKSAAPPSEAPQPNETTESSPSGLPPEPTHPSESQQTSEPSGATKAPLCDPNVQLSCDTPQPPLERAPPTQGPGEAVDLQSRFKEDDNREPLTEPPPAPGGYSLRDCLAQHKFGIYAHDSDPNKFYMCTKVRPLELTCREGLQFDEESYGCNRPKGTTPAPPPDLGIRECITKYHRGVFPHPSDCAKFYACSRTGPVEKMCPLGLNFNPQKMVCDWPSRHCVSPAAKTRDLILRSMKRDNIFPDLVDRCPDKLAEVAFPSGGQADLGKSLTPSQALQPPSIYWEADKRSFYTLCMVDPDAPSKEGPSQWNHWMVGNIPGNKISQGQPLAEYLPPCPQQNSPPHRYTYMIYKQPSKLQFQEPHIPSNSFRHRDGFDLRNFTQKYQLGPPIAGNYFKCSWDKSVPQTLQRLMYQPPKFSMTIVRPGSRSSYSNSYSYSYSFRSG